LYASDVSLRVTMGIKHGDMVSDLLRNGWAKPEESTRLLTGEVQVWRLDLACAEGRSWVEAGWELLSSEEAARARRIRIGSSRNEMVAGRAALRCLLSRELERDANEIEFRVGEHGKPELSDGELAFNMTHSQGMILIALSRAGDVGIDVEDQARPIEAMDVARTVFHPEELQLLQETTEEQRSVLFYRVWTRKEAVAKADGRGLMLPPRSFSVAHFEGKNVAVASHEQPFNCCEDFTGDGTNVEKYHNDYYHLLDLRPGRDFIAALASSRRIDSLAQYDFTPARDLKRGTPLVSFASEMA
jgi:4'-phosphopantetheinyl transferase